MGWVSELRFSESGGFSEHQAEIYKGLGFRGLGFRDLWTQTPALHITPSRDDPTLSSPLV